MFFHRVATEVAVKEIIVRNTQNGRKNESRFMFGLTWLNHGLTIKWTWHIGFLTLAGMDPFEEWNHGKNSKRVARVVFIKFGKFLF